MTIKTFDEYISNMETVREVRGDVPGLFHANINVLSRETLEDTMENPEEYPSPMVRISGYAVNFVKPIKEQQRDVLSCTFHQDS